MSAMSLAQKDEFRVGIFFPFMSHYLMELLKEVNHSQDKMEGRRNEVESLAALLNYTALQGSTADKGFLSSLKKLLILLFFLISSSPCHSSDMGFFLQKDFKQSV